MVVVELLVVVASGVWEMERSRVSLVALKRVVAGSADSPQAGSTLQRGSGRADSPQAKEAGLI